MMGGMWLMMTVWIVLGLAVLAVGAYAVVRITGSAGSRDDHRDRAISDAAQDQLRRRYAAGEIDREAYLQGRADLDDG